MTRLRVAGDVRPTHVYYCFTAGGTLLYVGSAMQPQDRFEFHRYHSGKEWPHHVEYVICGAALPTLADARDLERREIGRLSPACNKHHNPTPTPWEPDLDARRPWLEPPTFIACDTPGLVELPEQVAS